MFEDSIENVLQFTRPILSATRSYAGALSAGAATIFFVNEEGVAITCKHVADLLIESDKIWQKYEGFKEEKSRLVRGNMLKTKLSELELQYNFQPETTIQLLNTFQNCFDKISGFSIQNHPTLDLAIIRFTGFERKLYNSHATFVRQNKNIRIGKTLCRLGYPFPEFSNFMVNPASDNLEWTNAGNPNTPVFPIDGIITRFVGENNEIVGIELSTPGLKGQSGGPLFDRNGLIYGMQSMTMHLHLGFDIKDLEIETGSGKQKISNYPFMHVGRCVHAHRITEFLRQNGVKYYEEAELS